MLVMIRRNACKIFEKEFIFSMVVDLPLGSLQKNVNRHSQVFYKKIFQILRAPMYKTISYLVYDGGPDVQKPVKS